MEIIERVAGHYEARDVEFGRVYSWCPECVVLECACGEKVTCKRADIISCLINACECGEDKDNMAVIRGELVFRLLDESDEAAHPWRYWHPPSDAGIPF